MEIRDGFTGTIGNTPLIRLGTLCRETGCEILGKAEFLNPGVSVKDSAALYIIRDAEQRGALQPGGTVVEGTAGNTGIGLAHICSARGYRCVIIIPETQSREKMDLLRVLGAELRPVSRATSRSGSPRCVSCSPIRWAARSTATSRPASSQRKAARSPKALARV